MVFDAHTTANNAVADDTNTPGFCLQWCRQKAGIPPLYPDAATAWRNVNDKHTGRDAKRGAPVYWTGGANGFGHIAISLGNGMIRSTDAGGPGKVATVPIGWPEQHWGLHYAGSGEDINEVAIPGLAPRGHDLLHLMEHSLQHTDTPEAIKHTMVADLQRGPHMALFTEIKKFTNILATVCEEEGYHPVYPGGDDVGYAIRNDLVISGVGATPVLPANGHHPGGYVRRDVNWVTALWESNRVSYTGTHWITGWDDPARRKRNVKLTNAVGNKVVDLGRGARLSFMGGDTNWDVDDKNHVDLTRILRKNGIEVVWDELDQHPGTRGRRTIDVIGSYTHDGRVKARRAKVWPPGGSDHRAISAWYTVLEPL